ncbi:hypothetical protein [Amaricoccus tamworthensis]|uniref:hypothetical protein n=1 Tax=Amaricoccus tamworthensis TaxID=57002 RepID=UPI003C79EAF4
MDQDLREREYGINQVDNALPWLGLTAFLLVFIPAVMLARFIAGNLGTYVLLGGSWSTTNNVGKAVRIICDDGL